MPFANETRLGSVSGSPRPAQLGDGPSIFAWASAAESRWASAEASWCRTTSAPVSERPPPSPARKSSPGAQPASHTRPASTVVPTARASRSLTTLE